MASSKLSAWRNNKEWNITISFMNGYKNQTDNDLTSIPACKAELGQIFLPGNGEI